MARKATKDTFAIEDVGGVEVRRQVFAGDVIPSQYQVEEGSFEEFDDPREKKIGREQGGAPQAAYGDSPDPRQKEQAEATQSQEQQESPQSPADPESSQAQQQDPDQSGSESTGGGSSEPKDSESGSSSKRAGRNKG